MEKNNDGRIPWNKGIARTEEVKQKIREKLIGRFTKENNPAWKGGREISCLVCGKTRWVKPSKIKKNGNFCSRECVHKYLSEHYAGKNAFTWKGGVTEIHHELRIYVLYKLWRKSVFTRDEFICQECGNKKGGNLNAHHILSFANFPHLRLNIKNGITLCKECHKKIHERKR